MQSEQGLLEKYINLRLKKIDADTKLKEISKEVDAAQIELLDYLEANNATATAKYEGIGYAKVLKPRLFASCRVENKPQLMEHLKDKGRTDLIKTDVHAGSLSSWVSEQMENGATIPEFVTYYLKPQLRLFK